MNASTTLREDPLLPQRTDGMSAGAVMALLAHLLLILGLAFGVSWHASEPEGVTAELWSAVPQVAAPKPVPPPPEPVVKETPKPLPPKPAPEPPQQAQRDADIAIEKARQEKKAREEEAQREKARKEQAEREKAQKDKAEKERQAKAEQEDAKRKQKQEQARLAKQAEQARKDYLARMMNSEGTGAPDATGTAARNAGPSANYAGRIKARIKPNIVLTDDINGNPVAEVELRVAPDGTIVGRKITKSSGVQAWDDAVLRAIDRTEVLPRDTDGRVPPAMVIAFRPKD